MNKKIKGIILLLIGMIILIVGLGVMLVGGNNSKLEDSEPTDVYYATETDEYSYVRIQYMTESVAYYEAMESMQFYIVYDSDFNPAVICLHDDMLDTYQPYIDWFYSDSYENEPEELTVTGYAQPFDRELYDFVEESFVYDWGEEIMDDATIVDYFGEYYLQVGEKNGAYKFSNIGIFLLIAAIVMIVIGGAFILGRSDDYSEETGPIIQSGNSALGVLGAMIGAILGGILWTVVGALGYISGWLGILIIFLAYKGYEIMAHKIDKFGLIISALFGLIIILPATYFSYGWNYYCAVNESVSGYTTLGRALTELPVYMESVGGWRDFASDIFMGYIFMIVACIYFFASQISSQDR